MEEIVYLVLASLPGIITGLIALSRVRRKSKLDSLDEIRILLDNLKDDNAKLRGENQKLDDRVAALEQANISLTTENAQLKAAIDSLSDSFSEQQSKIEQYRANITWLRERLRNRNLPAPEALAIMRLLPERARALAEMAKERCDDDVLTEAILEMATLIINCTAVGGDDVEEW